MTVSSPLMDQERDSARRSHGSTIERGGNLFSPLIDFVCLGGGSLLLLIPLMLLDVETYKPTVAATTLLIAHFINSPHFAHSYQIFYRNFAAKAFGKAYPAVLRTRYIVAGIVVPIALAAFFVTAAASGNARALGVGINIMLFFVGWHYVKQGYGMIIVDSVLKKNFFPQRDKSLLVLNAYVCWVASWLFLNAAVARRDMFGLTSYSIPVPDLLLYLAALVTVATSTLALASILRQWRSNQPFPVNGVVAYLVTLYIWMLLPAVAAPAVFVALVVLVTPAAHSLQYLVVVWRYQLNVERDRPRPARTLSLFRSPETRLAYFFIFGVVVSFCGFWVIPLALDLTVAYDRAEFGSQMFLFIFAVFINVHHYFLDNVMWRRENPDIGKYLFQTS